MLIFSLNPYIVKNCPGCNKKGNRYEELCSSCNTVLETTIKFEDFKNDFKILLEGLDQGQLMLTQKINLFEKFEAQPDQLTFIIQQSVARVCNHVLTTLIPSLRREANDIMALQRSLTSIVGEVQTNLSEWEQKITKVVRSIRADLIKNTLLTNLEDYVRAMAELTIEASKNKTGEINPEWETARRVKMLRREYESAMKTAKNQLEFSTDYRRFQETVRDLPASKIPPSYIRQSWEWSHLLSVCRGMVLMTFKDGWPSNILVQEGI